MILPFNWWPRHYQLSLWNYLEGGGKRAVAMWHRRAGKDLFAINWIASRIYQRVGLYWHTFPTYAQGKKVIWDGSTKDGRKFLDHFPPELIAAKNDTDMRITFKNGSVYQVVGVDDPDRLVGANPIGVVYSEFSLQNPKARQILAPILTENDGWEVYIYTARGDNHGKFLYDLARSNPKWFCELLTIDTTKKELVVNGNVVIDTVTNRPVLVPVITQEAVEEDRKMGMPEELIQSEYYNSFAAPLVGAFYAQQMLNAEKEGRMGNVPWEPNLQVDTSWDLGVDDSTSIWFTQEYGANEIRVIDFYENSGEGLPHYAKILSEKPYAYKKHYAPHDITVRELGTGKSRIETARSLGIRFDVVRKHDVADGIEAVRNLLPRCWFDAKKTEHGIKCLRSYKKKYDEERRVYRDSPDHDWSSHASDAFRTFAFSRKDKAKMDASKLPKYSEMEYNIFGSTKEY